ncbi:MAG TPA: SDR family oxidoreductase [Micropepsaceae bacterium]|nr:SDR family oxidoreductase [Micropepsaceae bacterium]
MNRTRDGLGRTALVTGASAGIGMALAHVFAANGFDLVLTARRADRLIALANELHGTYGVKACPMAADLARPETPADLVGTLSREGIAIDVLVNNAGYGVPGLFRETPWEAQRDFLQVLVTAPCELAHRVLPGMSERGYGRILNVASVAGLMPGSASHTLYGAAKALLIKFSQSLHSEQSETGVFVSVLCPGFTYSEFHDVNGTRAAMQRLPRFLWLSAERVAEDGYRAVMKNQPICIPGAQYRLISAAVRLMPMSLAYRLGRQRSRLLRQELPEGAKP